MSAAHKTYLWLILHAHQNINKNSLNLMNLNHNPNFVFHDTDTGSGQFRFHENCISQKFCSKIAFWGTQNDKKMYKIYSLLLSAHSCLRLLAIAWCKRFGNFFICTHTHTKANIHTQLHAHTDTDNRITHFAKVYQQRHKHYTHHSLFTQFTIHHSPWTTNTHIHTHIHTLTLTHRCLSTITLTTHSHP